MRLARIDLVTLSRSASARCPMRLTMSRLSKVNNFRRTMQGVVNPVVSRCSIPNPNRKIFEARKRETAALGAGEKLVLGHPLAATIGDSARCMQNLEKVLFTGPKTSDTVTFICD